MAMGSEFTAFEPKILVGLHWTHEMKLKFSGVLTARQERSAHWTPRGFIVVMLFWQQVLNCPFCLSFNSCLLACGNLTLWWTIHDDHSVTTIALEAWILSTPSTQYCHLPFGLQYQLYVGRFPSPRVDTTCTLTAHLACDRHHHTFLVIEQCLPQTQSVDGLHTDRDPIQE
jgi:hypothetical protein